MRYLIVLGTLLALAGCGGGGGASVPIVTFPAVNTDRAGSWQGRATDSVTSDAGVLSLTIDDKGAVRGTWRTDAGVSWDVSGVFESIPASFQNTITLTMAAAGQRTLIERGSMSVGTNGELGGVFRDIRQVEVGGPALLLSELTVNLQRQ